MSTQHRTDPPPPDDLEPEDGSPEPANEGGPPRLTAEQRRLFDAGMPMVLQCAGEIGARLRYPAEDLLGAGTLALAESARLYEPDLHPSFPVYARHHIMGRMVDAIRAEPSTSSRRIERVMERAFHLVSSQRVASPDFFRADEDTVLAQSREGAAAVLASAFLAGLLDKQKEDAEEGVIERLWLRDGVARLPRHEREVMELYYWHGQSLEQIGKALGIHRKTAQARHVHALDRLHQMLVNRPRRGP